VLTALHVDAIRLDPDGQIAVAYPFSATPTRHRVRIGGHVEALFINAPKACTSPLTMWRNCGASTS
jgi:hypothetical protein